ncbi:MAG TPA: serine hydrolase [Flavisolibacter sp.]|nr:serine hydrolase [Flavisolibacter sp.]
MDELKKVIQKELDIANTRFGVAFKDLQTGEILFINENENFHAASTMKTPVLVELFKQSAQGNFSMDDSIVIKNSFKSIVDGSSYSLTEEDDSEKELYTQVGAKKTIASLAYDMIIQSSNLATNILIELVQPANVMNTLHQLGATHMKVLRGVEDNKAYQKGMNNTTTALDLLLIFEQIANEQLVSAAACRAMINILLDQKFNEIIPAHLPGTVKVAHKTGSITGIQHDSGIVFLPDGKKYVLVLLSQFQPADEKKVIQAMANVSKHFYNHMLEK